MHTERLTPRGGKARPGDRTCRGNGTLAFRERPTTRMNPNIHSSQTLSLNPVEQSFSRSEKAVEPSPRGILVLGSRGVPCPGLLNRSLRPPCQHVCWGRRGPSVSNFPETLVIKGRHGDPHRRPAAATRRTPGSGRGTLCRLHQVATSAAPERLP